MTQFSFPSSIRRWLVPAALLFVLPVCAVRADPSGTYKDLHDFGGTVTNANNSSGPDGKFAAGITLDNAGDVFGTTQQGGASNSGMVWEITTGDVYKDLHDFGGTVKNANGTNGSDGIAPFSSASLDNSGDLLGTAFEGGPNDPAAAASGAGIVWEITSGGTYKDLHDFGGTVKNAGGANGQDGINPVGDITLDNSDNMFGTTTIGGPNSFNGVGVIWEITSGGTYKDLHDFGGTVTNANSASGPDGTIPFAPVAFDAAGNMFGTTENGGPNNVGGGGDGMVWEITSAGTYVDLRDFGGTFTNSQSQTVADGEIPATGVALSSGGDVFGTVEDGGPNTGSGEIGLVWELTGEASIDIGLSAGLQMFSLPYTYSGVSLSTLFGYANPALAAWSPVTGQYDITPTAPSDQVSLGQAYWVKFPQAVTITQAGTPADTTQNFDITLTKGWNMIGDPFLVSVPIANLLFNDGAETFAQATSGANPLINSTVWSFPVGSSIYATALSLVPEQGYWIFASSNTDVQIPHP